MSGFPSPSRSVMEIPLKGPIPVIKSTFGAKVTIPVVLKFLNTETVFETKFETARSAFPSPSRSPIDTPTE